MNLDRRQRARVRAELAVYIDNPAGDPLCVNTVDVSASGLQLACNDREVRLIVPPGRALFNPHGSEVELRLSIPDPQGSPVVAGVSATIVYCRRLSQREYRIGVVFGSLPDQAAEALARFSRRTG